MIALEPTLPMGPWEFVAWSTVMFLLGAVFCALSHVKDRGPPPFRLP